MAESLKLFGNSGLNSLIKDRDKIDGAILLEGPRGSGKKTAAFLLAMAVMCSGENPPCFDCGPCLRMLAGSHSDYEFVACDSGLKVGDVREIRKKSYWAPGEGDKKVFVIENADLMNEQAQNAFLKTLEEPVSSVFILLCENSQRLLMTVRSRCRIYRMEPLPDSVIFSELRKRMPDESDARLRELCAIGGGWLGRALEGERGLGEADELAKEFFDALLKGEAYVAMFSFRRLNGLERKEYLDFLDSAVSMAEKINIPQNVCVEVCELLNRQTDDIERINASIVVLSSALAAGCGRILNK